MSSSQPSSAMRSEGGFERLEPVFRLTEAVSRAGALEDIYERALEALRAALGADRASILLFDPDNVLRFKAWHRLSDAYRRAVEGHTPWKPEQHDARPILVPDVREEPALASLRSTISGEGIRALAFIPLAYGDRLLGKFMVYFDAPHAFDRDEVGLAEAIARHVAFAVDRDRGEEKRRRAVEALRFLARTSEQLDASLDHAATLEKVARVAVPFLATASALDVPREAGTLRRAAASGDGPAGGGPSAQTLDRVFLLGELHTATTSDRAELVLPLRARGRTLGVLSIWREAARPYEGDDLSVGVDLARRCALAIDNARLYREAQDSDRRKDEFLAMLAHELRNPLAPMLTAVQLMTRKAGDRDTVDRARVVVERQVRHMTRLVDDLLDVSRITRGKIELRRQPVDLASVITRAVEMTRPLIEAAHHALTVVLAPGAVVDGDPIRLEQVLSNLITNAAKYTPPGGSITIAAGTGGDTVTVSVKDNGRGILPALLPRIFDPFVQGEGAQGGLGIGLTLVRRLVEFHGGQVEARSGGQGLGSEFIVTLPLARAPAVPQTPSPGDSRHRRAPARRILVVDDNEDAGDVLAEALRESGHHVARAGDGTEALALALTFDPEIVLLDIGLPGMDGYEVGRRLLARPTANAPILIAVSGYGRDSDRARSRSSGFAHHLTKPVDLEALEVLLREL